jgi:sortase A
MRKRKSKLRWLEYLFLLAGLGAIDYYVWANVQSGLYQMYSEWKFERSLRGEDWSVVRFIVDESGLRRIVGLGKPLEPMPHVAGPAQHSSRHFKKDELLGRLEIPRLNIRVMVREGDDHATLSHAAGHVPSTAFPGELGNVAFAAHRDTFFRPLRNIKKDDTILVSTLDGDYEYAVQSTEIVSPSDVSVLKASASRELTLVTCYPFYYIGSAPHRFVVHAIQVAAKGQQPAKANLARNHRRAPSAPRNKQPSPGVSQVNFSNFFDR